MISLKNNAFARDYGSNEGADVAFQPIATKTGTNSSTMADTLYMTDVSASIPCEQNSNADIDVDDGFATKTKTTPETQNTEGNNNPEEKREVNKFREFFEAYKDTYWPKINKHEYIWYKAMWTVIYFVLFGLMVSQLTFLIQEFTGHPTTISVEIVRSGQNDFPGVTFCNENPLRKSLLSRLKHYEDLVLLDRYMASSLDAFFKVRSEENDCKEETHFKCLETDDCIPNEWACNGVVDCEDGSDEAQNCTKRQIGWNEQEVQGICKWPYIQCPDEMFCAARCDGIPECSVALGYDETPAAGCETPTCGGNFNASLAFRNITSPNYPGFYNSNEECIYTIEAESNSSFIELRLNEIAIERGVNARICTDYLEIYDTDFENLSPKLCGFSVPHSFETLNSTGHKATIRFKSDGLHVARGFSISYRAVPQSKQQNTSIEKGKLPISFDPETRQNTSAAISKCILLGQEDCDNSNIRSPDFVKIYQFSRANDYTEFKKMVFFPQTVLANFGYELDDLLIHCVFDGEECDESLFTKYQHADYGNCYSFNSIRNKKSSASGSIKSTKSGKDSGLKLTFFLESDDYMGVMTPDSGIRVLVHDSRVNPNMRQRGLSIRPGESTVIALEMLRKQRQGGKFSNCTDSWPPELHLNEEFKAQWPKYDRLNCLFICYRNEVLRRCGCTDSFYEDINTDSELNEASKNHCDPSNETQSECLGKSFQSFYGDNANCPCPQSCSTLYFKELRATAAWPSDAYIPFFEADVLRSHSRRVVRYMTRLLSGNISSWEVTGRIRENFARVEIYYMTLEFERIVEEPKYNWFILIGLFGGILKVFLCWDLIKLLTFNELIAILIYRWCQRKDEETKKNGDETDRK